MELRGHVGTVWSVAWQPQGLLASCGQDGTIRLWDQGSCVSVANEDGSVHPRTIRRVEWRGDGDMLAAASFDGKTSLWRVVKDSLVTMELVHVLEGHEHEVKSVSFSPDGELLATCSRDKSIFIFDVKTGETVSVLQGHTQDVKCVKFSSDGERLISASYDDTVKIWAADPDGDDWSCSSTLRGHQGTVWSCSFDTNSTRIISSSADGTLKLWMPPGLAPAVVPPWLITSLVRDRSGNEGQLGSWRCVATLQGVHNGPIYDLDWKHLLATVCGDNVLRVFRVNETSPFFTLLWSARVDMELNSVRWHPIDQTKLATAGDDGLVRVWSIPLDLES